MSDVTVVCPICLTEFTREAKLYHKLVHNNQVLGGNGKICCSRSCASKSGNRRFAAKRKPKDEADRWEQILQVNGLGVWAGSYGWLCYGEEYEEQKRFPVY
jgi:hypothetical protein